MHGLVISAFGVSVWLSVGVDVGGMGVLVEVGMDVLLGGLAGREVPQADEINARAIANLASQIFFIFRSLLAILIFAETDLKKRELIPNVSIFLRHYRNPDNK